MSVHLKENVVPMAKKGKPGNIKLVRIGSKPLKRIEIEYMSREIVERAKSDFKSFIEIEMGRGHGGAIQRVPYIHCQTTILRWSGNNRCPTSGQSIHGQLQTSRINL